MSALLATVITTLRRAGLIESVLAARDQAADVLQPLRRNLARRRYGLLLARYDGLLLAHSDGAWEVARRDDHLVVRDVMADNLDRVVGALERRGVPCFVVPIPSPNRYRVGVPAAHRRAALDALAAISDPAVHLYLDDPTLAPRHRRIALGVGVTARARARALQRPLWRIYVNHADAQGLTVLGHLHGCEVEFWSSAGSSGGAGSLVAERWNKKAVEVPADVPAGAELEIAGRGYPTLPEFTAAPHFDDITFPIDVVYTWVDGSDPAWLERKNAVLRDLNLATVHPDAHDASRYRSRDELRYSLRSIAMFADFVHRIYIVTDDQTPPWLNTDHPQVTVVSHKEIFGTAGRLPTFNSHAIEARLHHIDGLAEHYLYLNDDFLFCRRVLPDTFFLSNGQSRFFLSTALIGRDDGSGIARSVDAAGQRSRALVERHFGRVTHQKMKHAPYAQRRSVLLEAEEAFAEEFAATSASQIRSPTDVPVASSFSHYYAYLTGRAVPGDIAARYVELSSEDFDRRLRDLERRRNADTLCINDAATRHTPDVAGRERRLQEFLDRYWPVKSPFEW